MPSREHACVFRPSPVVWAFVANQSDTLASAAVSACSAVVSNKGSCASVLSISSKISVSHGN
ncbi:hypothetical protein PXO_05834 [Xanthomonas oryzae pv. oryzae PXO99A]|uniref:Uncharacterized protein n=1 Tax=Xanthomonas oryzae pv. oryzae (strain PXO99A) TaxID=360094 RepID=A0A0K0GKV7_XANOP|nr:hypothetical protein PXO_05834 [Xanthomonas oryzae pv. oryzae PXO99A]